MPLSLPHNCHVAIAVALGNGAITPDQAATHTQNIRCGPPRGTPRASMAPSGPRRR
jgi:hypothetical protein